ncbi:uncharacterized protein [Fopius arisanus]|uniref:Uncharacterized protein n=1 Tax=Fopius arisanus TaxID=64838 RepID=A0A9R1U9N0_9HYME|nr:PREDICTED: uncharacterized protein LOC105272240 [Fopius arisanus]XP_011312568.1 PREDICTED: uncharacterized protein LOC105272240 [Fopius arisanus]
MDDFVPTRCAHQQKTPKKDFVSVTYTSHKKKTPSTADKSINPRRDDLKPSPEDLKRQQELEMKRLRWDVMKFGASGFTGAKKNEAKVALVLQLGGKPVKNRKNENYKQLKVKKSRERARAKKQESGLTHSLTKINTKTKRKRQSTILDVYGKVDRKIKR